MAAICTCIRGAVGHGKVLLLHRGIGAFGDEEDILPGRHVVVQRPAGQGSWFLVFAREPAATQGVRDEHAMTCVLQRGAAASSAAAPVAVHDDGAHIVAQPEQLRQVLARAAVQKEYGLQLLGNSSAVRWKRVSPADSVG